MGWSQVQIANLALASIGSSPLQSLQDAAPAGSAVALMYPYVVNGIFAEYPWAFARLTQPLEQVALPTLSDGNLLTGWAYAYAIPANLIGPPEKFLANARFPDDPLREFEVQAGVVYCNQTALWCTGVAAVDEASWPDYFTTAIVKCLAAELYPLITGNGSRLAELQTAAWGAPQENRCGGALGVARRRDAALNPSRVIARNPLIDVRTATVEVRPTGLGLG